MKTEEVDCASWNVQREHIRWNVQKEHSKEISEDGHLELFTNTAELVRKAPGEYGQYHRGIDDLHLTALHI